VPRLRGEHDEVEAFWRRSSRLPKSGAQRRSSRTNLQLRVSHPLATSPGEGVILGVILSALRLLFQMLNYTIAQSLPSVHPQIINPYVQ
jgi:hypothetical protein